MHGSRVSPIVPRSGSRAKLLSFHRFLNTMTGTSSKTATLNDNLNTYHWMVVLIHY